MMYPYMTLNDDTEITHSEMRPDGRVMVYIETRDATRIWITSMGRALLCHNKSKIPERVLNRLLRVIEANAEEFIKAWHEHFGEIRFFC